MIRKIGKRWVYECRDCDVLSVQLDLLRVTEAKNRHQRTWGHIFRPATLAVQDLGLVIRKMFGVPDEVKAPELKLPALADKTPIVAGKIARMDPQLYLNIFGATRKDSGT